MNHLLWIAATLIALSPCIFGQSTMEFELGTSIEVTGSADICADSVIINGSFSGDGTRCGGTLPVELVGLAVNSARDVVALTWTTATERDNFGFEIERRSVADKGHPAPWAHAGFVAGSGTTTSPRRYSFTEGGLSPGRYAYRIRQIDRDGSSAFPAEVEVEVGLAPREFALHQNYPNPFNPTTTIEFTLEEDGRALLKLYDVTGRELMTLLNEGRKAGYLQSVVVDARKFGSGTYICTLEAGGKVLSRKMMLLK